MNDNRKGYWSGMPAHLKGRIVGWTTYFLIGAFLFTQNKLLGGAILALPFLWMLLVFALFEYLDLDIAGRGRPTVLSYTISYLWTASALSRAFLCTSGAILIGGTLWLAYGDTILEPDPPPTITERIGERTGGWVDTAKDWFSRD